MTSDRAAGTEERRAGVGAGRLSKRSTEPARSRPRVETGAPAEPPVDIEHKGPDADPESVARTILLDQLAGRARSRHELADKLRQRGVPDEMATRLLDRFEEVGLVDDAAFAQAWVSGRHTAKGLAARAIAQELRRKGVEDEVAREALGTLGAAEQDATARALVAKRVRSLARFDRPTQERRLVGMLARKGYPPGLAFRVVRDQLGAEVEEPETP